jgi:alcohol dehydrogenase
MNFINDNFEIIIKNQVKFGVGLTKNLPAILKEYAYKRIGFIIDGNLYDHLPSLKAVISDCEKEFDKVVVHIYREKFEPTYQFLDKVKLEFKSNNAPLVDCIVGIGGGSAIDAAKGIATLATNHEAALSYRGFPVNLNPSLPIIAIPSTAGTGTELAFNAVFIDLDANKKLGINTKNNYPTLAILDPEIVATAPKSVAISAGIDALVHTLESFVSVKSNYITKIFSKEAFRLLLNTLPKLVKDPKNIDYWANMQWGAYLAMAGLSNSSSGPTGALSYHLGTQFNVPHGIAGAVFIGKISRINLEQGYTGYSELYSCLDNYDKTVTDAKEQSKKVVEAIEHFLTQLEIPATLTSFGVKEKDFDSFFEFAKLVKGAFDFNPVKISEDKIADLLKSMIGGR